MRVLAIKDESLSSSRILGYLIYYENPRTFYIELPENADPWETPLILDSFVKRGETSVGSYWSRLWVEQRIVPPDRQNIGQILKENGLSEYDEFSLLELSGGRCAQDDCYLEEISVNDLPEEILERRRYKVEDIVPLENARLLAFFQNGESRMIDLKALTEKYPACEPYINSEKLLDRAEVQPGGYGVMWNERAAIPDHELYVRGEPVPVSLRDFCRFVQTRVVSASEAGNILNCSRQNIDDLIRRDKLHPIRKDQKYKLFLRNEVVQRKKADRE